MKGSLLHVNLRSTVTKVRQVLDEYRKKNPEIAAPYMPPEKHDGEAHKG
jgi:hypothetical protein